MLVLTLGPYLFGLPAHKVAKQLVYTYITSICLFLYMLITQSIFNPIMMYPLMGVNVLICIWGIVLTVQASGAAGEPMF